MQTPVEPGDEGYTTLYAQWVKEGRASQFDRIGSFGGQIWRAHGDGPTFLLIAAAGPTDDGHDKPADWQPHSGFEVEMQETGLEFIRGPGGDGDMRIKMHAFPRDKDAI